MLPRRKNHTLQLRCSKLESSIGLSLCLNTFHEEMERGNGWSSRMVLLVVRSKAGSTWGARAMEKNRNMKPLKYKYHKASWQNIKIELFYFRAKILGFFKPSTLSRFSELRGSTFHSEMSFGQNPQFPPQNNVCVLITPLSKWHGSKHYYQICTASLDSLKNNMGKKHRVTLNALAAERDPHLGINVI